MHFFFTSKQTYKTDAKESYTQNVLHVFTKKVICNFTVICESAHTLLDIPPLQANVTVVVLSAGGDHSFSMEYYRVFKIYDYLHT